MIELTTPLSEDKIRSLKVGDEVALSGVIVTGRDAAHKYLTETFINNSPPPAEEEFLKTLGPIMEGGVIYHCGPVVKKVGEKWEFVAAGPTTSIREEPYQAGVIKRFGLRGVIGKGGMGPATLQGLKESGAVYFHAVGGAASLIARSVVDVKGVYKMEFGQPEAFWVIEVKKLQLIVTMDSHGNSLHADIDAKSAAKLEEIIAAV